MVAKVKVFGLICQVPVCRHTHDCCLVVDTATDIFQAQTTYLYICHVYENITCVQ